MKLVRTGVGVTGTGNTGIGVRGTSNNICVRGDGDGFGVVGVIRYRCSAVRSFPSINASSKS